MHSRNGKHTWCHWPVSRCIEIPSHSRVSLNELLENPKHNRLRLRILCYEFNATFASLRTFPTTWRFSADFSDTPISVSAHMKTAGCVQPCRPLPLPPCRPRTTAPSAAPPSSPHPSACRRPSVPVERHGDCRCRGDIVESAKAPPHGTRRSGALMSSSPPSSPHPSAAVARPSPVPRPSSVMVHGTVIPRRDDPDHWRIASKPVTTPVAHRIVRTTRTRPAAVTRRTAVKNAYFLCKKRVHFN